MLRLTRLTVMPLLYVLALVLPFALDNAAEFSEHLPDSIRTNLEAASARYQRWSSGPRPLEPRYTTLVSLTENSLPSVVADSCKQRDLLTRLLPRLADFGASAIVLDISLGRDSCPDSANSSITSNLIRTLQSTAQRVPVILGQATKSLEEVDEEKAQDLRRHGVVPNGVLLQPIIALPFTASNLQIGLIRSNADVRRIPLEWAAYREQNDKIVYAGPRPSLALQAARVVRQSFPNGLHELNQLIGYGLHPFTNFLPAAELANVNAADLLCGTGFELSGHPVCSGLEPEQHARQVVSGKAAIVGWNGYARDMWKTPVGVMPGIAVHANYLEALLDSHFLKPISYWWQIAVSLAWFVLIEITFVFWPERALITAPLIMLTVSFVIYYVAVVNLGLYLALFPPSICALLLRFWERWFERLREHHAKRRAGSGPRSPAVSPTIPRQPEPIVVGPLSKGS